MNVKILFVIGTVLIVAGITLSVGANSGFIKDTRAIEANLDVGEWDPSHGYAGNYGPLLLSETELRPGDSVTIEFNDWSHCSTAGITLTLYVEDSTGATVKTQEFVYLGWGGGYGWEPDWTNDAVSPSYWPLFIAQELGVYSVYASIYHPENTGNRFVLTCHTLITSPPPYAMVLVLGVVVVALGALAIIVGAILGLKKPKSSGPPP